jgi:hypothetical protein
MVVTNNTGFSELWVIQSLNNFTSQMLPFSRICSLVTTTSIRLLLGIVLICQNVDIMCKSGFGDLPQ